MGTTKIKVSDYYISPVYYSVMPVDIFNALEAATLSNEEYTNVDKSQFDQMIIDYKKKVGL